MTNSNSKSTESIVENTGLALNLFKEMCCNDCICQTESNKIEETDNIGRKKIWENRSV